LRFSKKLVKGGLAIRTQKYEPISIFSIISHCTAIAINSHTSMVIVDELLEGFKIFITEILHPFRVPGQTDRSHFFTPKLFCSVIGFLGEQNGHIVFEQDRLLTEESVPELYRSIESQINVAFEVVKHAADSGTGNYQGSDEGLVPMLKTAILALQLLPSNCLAGIVIFTDGCSDVYSTETEMGAQYARGYGSTVPGEERVTHITGSHFEA